MKLLALDFDGVISDSAPECFVVGLRTYLDLNRDSKLAAADAALRSGRAPTRARVEGDPLYRPFVDLMPLGNRAEDFGIAFSALEARAAMPDQASYDAFRTQLSQEWLAAFHRRFYETRSALFGEDPAGWERLIRVVRPAPSDCSSSAARHTSSSSATITVGRNDWR